MNNYQTYSFPHGHIHTSLSGGHGLHTWQQYIAHLPGPYGFCDWKNTELFYNKELALRRDIYLSQEFFLYCPPFPHRLYFSLYPKTSSAAALLVVLSGWYHYHLKKKKKTIHLLKELAPSLRDFHFFYLPKQEPAFLSHFFMKFIHNLFLGWHTSWESSFLLSKLLSSEFSARRLCYMRHTFQLPHLPAWLFLLKYASHKKISYEKATSHPRFTSLLLQKKPSSHRISLPPALLPSATYLPHFQKNSLSSILNRQFPTSSVMKVYRYRYSYYGEEDYKDLQKIHTLSPFLFEKHFKGQIKQRHIVYESATKISLPAVIQRTLHNELVVPTSRLNL